MSSPPIRHPGTDARLAPPIIDRGAELLHAQCWLWGQDIRGPSGDLLVASGLTPARFEGARSHRSHYRTRLEGGRFVVSWSGGLLLGDPAGSLFLPRLRFAPVSLDVRSVEEVPDLNLVDVSVPAALSLHDLDLLRGAIEWLASYEDGVTRLTGPDWRREGARLWSEIEEGAREAAASVGVRYEPLAPLPEVGLGDGWRALGTMVALAPPEIERSGRDVVRGSPTP